MKYSFPKGHTINKGRKQSDEEKQKRSRIAKEKGFGKWMTGKKGNSGSFKKGQEPLRGMLGKTAWNKGIPHVAISKEKSYRWKPEGVGYRGIHARIQTLLGKASFCSFDSKHEATRFHWANISGKYLYDAEDWVSLCPKCHKQYDMIRRGRAYI